jgi:DNA repair protein RadB
VLSVCRCFDDLTGGLNEGITVVYGPQASGKSTFCMMAAHNCAKEGKKVAYITRERLSFERLEQICGEDFEHTVRSLRLSFPRTIDGLERAVKNSRKIPDLGLLIIDPVNEYYWIEKDREDSFIRIISGAAMLCRELHMPAILTASAYERNGVFEPFGFRDLRRTAKLMVELRVKGMKREIIVRARGGREKDLRKEFVMCDRGFE